MLSDCGFLKTKQNNKNLTVVSICVEGLCWPQYAYMNCVVVFESLAVKSGRDL